MSDRCPTCGGTKNEPRNVSCDPYGDGLCTHPFHPGNEAYAALYRDSDRCPTCHGEPTPEGRRVRGLPGTEYRDRSEGGVLCPHPCHDTPDTTEGEGVDLLLTLYSEAMQDIRKHCPPDATTEAAIVAWVDYWVSQTLALRTALKAAERVADAVQHFEEAYDDFAHHPEWNIVHAAHKAYRESQEVDTK